MLENCHHCQLTIQRQIVKFGRRITTRIFILNNFIDMLLQFFCFIIIEIKS